MLGTLPVAGACCVRPRKNASGSKPLVALSGSSEPDRASATSSSSTLHPPRAMTSIRRALHVVLDGLPLPKIRSHSSLRRGFAIEHPVWSGSSPLKTSPCSAVLRSTDSCESQDRNTSSWCQSYIIRTLLGGCPGAGTAKALSLLLLSTLYP